MRKASSTTVGVPTGRGHDNLIRTQAGRGGNRTDGALENRWGRVDFDPAPPARNPVAAWRTGGSDPEVPPHGWFAVALPPPGEPVDCPHATNRNNRPSHLSERAGLWPNSPYGRGSG